MIDISGKPVIGGGGSEGGGVVAYVSCESGFSTSRQSMSDVLRILQTKLRAVII